jgi:hypothetical protein
MWCSMWRRREPARRGRGDDGPIGPVGSFYSRHGDVFAHACVVVALATLLLCWLGLLPQ